MRLGLNFGYWGSGPNEQVSLAQEAERLGRNPKELTISLKRSLHFTDIDDRSTADYTVVVKNFRGDEVLRYPKSAFHVRREFWTKVVRGDRVTIEIRAAQPPAGLRFRIKEYSFAQPGGQVLSISGTDDREPIAAYSGDPEISRRARAVAKLVYKDGGVPKSCTAFLVAENIALTNEHCIRDQAMCDTAVALFGYHKVTDDPDQYDCVDLVMPPHHDLDYAFLRLEGRPGAPDKWGVLALRPRPLTGGEPLYIIQHPGGEPKQISRKDCKVDQPAVKGRGADVTDFSHTCDTVSGSSGSPVFDKDHHVVGLHHLGFSAGEWAAVNRAVQISRIPPVPRQ